MMNLFYLSMPFFLYWYTLLIFLIVILGIVLLITGAVRIYGGKSKLGRKNLFLLIVYRVIQLYSILVVVVLIVMLSSQLFSFKPYVENKKTGSSFGIFTPANGYLIPVSVNLNIPKRQVFIKAKVDSTIRTYQDNSSFSNNFNIQLEDSMYKKQLSAIFGKSHVPYLRDDTIENLINIYYPSNRSKGNSIHEGFLDKTITFIPPSKINAEASIRSSSSRKNLILSLFIYINLFSGLVIAFFLLKILSSFRKGELFNRKNFSSVSYIGLTLMLYQIFKLLLEWICDKWIFSEVTIWGSSNIPHYVGNMNAIISISYDFSFTLFFTGFLIVLFAQVFKTGFSMQEEQKLTI
ncbi:MAG: DUF2975 domain-containing protein [Chitinophagaceae bacterium]|nr:MAG: DUF2975 domain-containing protein [Chitinophagaceae bacterium]